jgi:hypothetical protein
VTDNLELNSGKESGGKFGMIFASVVKIRPHFARQCAGYS